MDGENAQICVYDSINSFRHATVERIKKYLIAEILSKKGLSIDSKKMCELDVKSPQQPNNFDCGIYLLLNAKLLLSNEHKSPSFNQADVDKCRAYTAQWYRNLVF